MLSNDAEADLEAVLAVADLPNLGQVLVAIPLFRDNITSVIKKKPGGTPA